MLTMWRRIHRHCIFNKQDPVNKQNRLFSCIEVYAKGISNVLCAWKWNRCRHCFQEQLTNSGGHTWTLAWKVLLCSFWTRLFTPVDRDTALTNNCNSRKLIKKSNSEAQPRLQFLSLFQHGMNLSKTCCWNSRYSYTNILCSKEVVKRYSKSLLLQLRQYGDCSWPTY